MSNFSALICISKNRSLDVDFNSIPEELINKEQEILGAVHWVFGNKTFEGLSQKYWADKTIWVLTKTNKYGWIQSKGTNTLINIIEDIESFPEGDYLILGGRAIFELFLPKLTSLHVFRHNKDYETANPFPAFESQFKNAETLLTNGEWEVILYK